MVPKMPPDYCPTLINRAAQDVYRKNLWSFQLFEANWVSPAVINAGSCTVTQGSNQVVFDADASAAITAVTQLPGPFPTPLIQRQFRVGVSTIYNIWAYSVDDVGLVTLTLDRPYTDASNVTLWSPGNQPWQQSNPWQDSGTPTGYMIYQCYYPVPFQDFVAWINIRDIVNYNDLVVTLTRKEIDYRDPQRTIFYLPTHAVPYQRDMNPASPTYGWQLWELWGQPQFQLVYQLYGIRNGPQLVNDSDMIPFAIGEDCVMAKAKYYAYQWAMANIGDTPRSQGVDWKFLMGAANKEYEMLYKDYRRRDRESVDNWYDIRRYRTWLSNVDGYYTSIGQTANPGSPWTVIAAASLIGLSVLHTLLSVFGSQPLC